jgi:hypothetical protein
MTATQLELFNLIGCFSVDTLMGVIDLIWETYGPGFIKGAIFQEHIVKFLNVYFNDCAASLYDRTDDYINGVFDKMLSVNVDNPYDPIDILQISVMLVLNLLQNMEINDIVGNNKPLGLSVIRCHLVSLVTNNIHWATNLNGCPPDHVHHPILRGEKVFSINCRQEVDGVPLSTL